MRFPYDVITMEKQNKLRILLVKSFCFDQYFSVHPLLVAPEGYGRGSAKVGRSQVGPNPAKG
jgi:hypothetical protein